MCVSPVTWGLLKKGKMDLQEKRHTFDHFTNRKKNIPMLYVNTGHISLRCSSGDIPRFLCFLRASGVSACFNSCFTRTVKLLCCSGFPPFPFWQLHPLRCTEPISSAFSSQSKPWIYWWVCIGEDHSSSRSVTDHTHWPCQSWENSRLGWCIGATALVVLILVLILGHNLYSLC